MFICDYLLWYFNTHGHFEYIDYMGLNEPEENCNMMLAKVRIFFWEGEGTMDCKFHWYPKFYENILLNLP